jgi:hypothetical protein
VKVKGYLRNDDDLYAPPARLSPTSNNPLTTLPKIWDSFVDENIKFICDKPEFDKALKTHFLSATIHSCPVSFMSVKQSSMQMPTYSHPTNK